MKPILYTLLFFFISSPALLFGQFHPDLNDQAFELYPGLEDMYGYAVAEYDQKAIIFGGRITNENPEWQSEDYPNMEIILIDYTKQQASAYSAYLYEGSLGEQMSAYGLAYYQQDSILFFMGGYAFNDSNKIFATYPYLSRMNVPQTIEALENGRSPASYIAQVCDQRIALFDAIIDFNGDEFFLLDGKNAEKRNALQENPMYIEENYMDEIRTFRIVDHPKYPQIENFNTWYDLQEFFDYYQDLIPEKIKMSIIDRIMISMHEKNDQQEGISPLIE
jgi:hypothetical protein